VSDRSKYSSALPWFRIVLKQRDFASFGRMGIARKIERAGETAGLPFSVHVHRMAGRRADLQPRWARASIGQGRREGRAPDRLASAAFSAADRGVLGANFPLVALRAAPVTPAADKPAPRPHRRPWECWAFSSAPLFFSAQPGILLRSVGAA
jgi:hypothetical protein